MCIDETTTMSNNVVGGLASIVFARRGAPCESRTGVGRSTTQKQLPIERPQWIGFAVRKLDVPCDCIDTYIVD